MNDEELKNNENLENNESNEMTLYQGINELQNNTNTKTQCYTSIIDEKLLFNLETNIDERLNDCVDEKIRFVDVLLKVIEKPLKEPVVDETTGEIIKSKEFKMITILVDENGKSYVTASKTFYYAMKKLLGMYSVDKVKEGIEIKVIKVPVKNTQNKALSFELI